MKRILIRGGLVIDGTGAPPIDKGVLLIEGERIISVGTLEPGKFGDIIGVKGNPLEDIRALKRVKTVVSRGEIKHQANQ